METILDIDLEKLAFLVKMITKKRITTSSSIRNKKYNTPEEYKEAVRILNKKRYQTNEKYREEKLKKMREYRERKKLEKQGVSQV